MILLATFGPGVTWSFPCSTSTQGRSLVVALAIVAPWSLACSSLHQVNHLVFSLATRLPGLFLGRRTTWSFPWLTNHQGRLPGLLLGHLRTRTPGKPLRHIPPSPDRTNRQGDQGTREVSMAVAPRVDRPWCCPCSASNLGHVNDVDHDVLQIRSPDFGAVASVSLRGPCRRLVGAFVPDCFGAVAAWAPVAGWLSLSDVSNIARLLYLVKHFRAKLSTIGGAA